jgi:uncharacterized protein
MNHRRNQKPDPSGLTRREFIRGAGITGGVILSGIAGINCAAASRTLSNKPDPSQSPLKSYDAKLPTRALGKMGFTATAIGMGGSFIPTGDETNGINILNRAYDLGITYYDTASQYGNGESERRYGIWLEKIEQAGNRDNIFLTTKTLSRGYDDAAREIEASYSRLRTKYINLLQVHAINTLKDWKAVTNKNGSLKAIEAAKKDGRVQHIGITGHKDPSVLLKALEEYPFDSVLMPLGIDDRFVGKCFATEALPKLAELGVSRVAMKVFGEGKTVREGVDLEKCIHYSLSLPASTVIIGMTSPEQVEQNVGWVHSFKGITSEEIEALTDDVKGRIDTNIFWWKK